MNANSFIATLSSTTTRSIIVLSIITTVSANIFTTSASASTSAYEQVGRIQTDELIDRYTAISSIESPAQKDPLSVIVSIKFAKSSISVKQAIEGLLQQSGYRLNQDYNVKKITSFVLPKVHKQLGPMPLKRMIKVLLGPAFDLHIDHLRRTIQIVRLDNNTLQVLTPQARVMLKEVIEPSVLGEVVALLINNNLLLVALRKILPKDWRVILSDDSQDLALKTVSVVSEDSNREVVIKQILSDVRANGFFYKKLKLLVVQNKQANSQISTYKTTKHNNETITNGNQRNNQRKQPKKQPQQIKETTIKNSHNKQLKTNTKQ